MCRHGVLNYLISSDMSYQIYVNKSIGNDLMMSFNLSFLSFAKGVVLNILSGDVDSYVQSLKYTEVPSCYLNS